MVICRTREFEVSELKNKWTDIIQVAMVYVGSIIGAGFATGKEIVEFFTQYGWYGFIGILISGWLFIWIGSRMMIMAVRINASTYKELNDYLFGKTVSSAVTLLVILIILAVKSVMLSGAGAVFEEQLGLSKQLGIMITIFFVFAVMVFGLKGLLSANLIFVPMIIVFSLIVSLTILFHGQTNYSPATYSPIHSFKWVITPFAYTAFNLALAQIVLVPLANEIKNEQVIKIGTILGGGLLSGLLLCNHAALSLLPNLLSYNIPMAEVVKLFFLSLYWVYIAIIYGAILTSIIGGVFGLQKQIRFFVHIPNILLLCILLFILYFISRIDYGSLLSFLYPILGYVSLGLLVLLAIKRIPKKNGQQP